MPASTESKSQSVAAKQPAVAKRLFSQACELSGGIMTTRVHAYSVQRAKYNDDAVLAATLSLGPGVSIRICLSPAMACQLAQDILGKVPAKDFGVNVAPADEAGAVDDTIKTRSPGLGVDQAGNSFSGTSNVEHRTSNVEFSVTKRGASRRDAGRRIEDSAAGRGADQSAVNKDAPRLISKPRKGAARRAAMTLSAFAWLEEDASRTISAAAEMQEITHGGLLYRMRTLDRERYERLPQRGRCTPKPFIQPPTNQPANAEKSPDQVNADSRRPEGGRTSADGAAATVTAARADKAVITQGNAFAGISVRRDRS